MVYETPILYYITLIKDDVITASSPDEEEWEDDNADYEGWT